LFELLSCARAASCAALDFPLALHVSSSREA
jgi:hypothetical protein